MTFAANTELRVACDANSDRTVASLLVLLILAYTIFALVQGSISFSMNRVIGGALILVLLYDYLRNLTSFKIVAACLVGLIAVVNMGINTTSLSDELEYWIYWGCTMLVLCYIARIGSLDELAAGFHRFGRLIFIVAVTAAAFVGILIATHTGYVVSWGGSSYFMGLCNTNHTMAAVCCIIMAMALMSLRPGSISILVTYLVCAVALFALLQTGARTFLVPAFIILILVVNRTIPWVWLRVIVLFGIGLTVVVVFASSGMADKFSYVAGVNGPSSASAFSSGRVDYWLTDLSAFFSTGVFNQFLGNSASFVYDLNEAAFAMRIWAHDDFVMTLCASGWLGLVLYICALKSFFGCLSLKLNKGQFVLMLIYVLFPAVINGFYGYQHLLYSTVIVACALSSEYSLDRASLRRAPSVY